MFGTESVLHTDHEPQLKNIVDAQAIDELKQVNDNICKTVEIQKKTIDDQASAIDELKQTNRDQASAIDDQAKVIDKLKQAAHDSKKPSSFAG